MTQTTSHAARWRVTARGETPPAVIDPGVLWEAGDMANADRWAERLVPGSGLTVEHYGTTRPMGEAVASVRMVVTIKAAGAPEAEDAVYRLLGQAMPRVTFTSVVAQSIIDRHDDGIGVEPLCSFCGKSQRQVKKLIAGPGVYVCDECVAMMSEIIADDAPAPDQ